MKIIIVGGVAGGATAAARLRRLDEDAEIILLERGEYVSFANCGLPYFVGGRIERRDALLVATRESIAAKYKIDIRTSQEVTKINRDVKTVDILDKVSGKSYSESYDRLLLSTGSHPFVPPAPGIDKENVFSLWTIPDADRIKAYIQAHQPRQAVVVGGGFIGLEMAENLVDEGLQTSIVEMAEQLMPPLDKDMAKIVQNHLQAKGVKLLLGEGFAGVREDGRAVLLQSGGEVPADLILLSIGVRPNSELARDAGLELNRRGGIQVDANMRTSDPAIYAIGDVVEIRDYMTGQPTMIPLAGPANRQGRELGEALLGRGDKPYIGTLGTSVAKIFDLTVASTGLNEKTLQRAGKVYKKDYFTTIVHPMSHAGYYPGALPLSLKLVFGADRAVLGAQIVGYGGVAKRIDTIATLLHFHGSIDDLSQLELAYAPPYSSAKDPVNFAGYVARDILDGLSDAVSWAEYLDNKAEYQLLDVREDAELLAGSLEGAQHIPLTQLRSRLEELDPARPYLCFCAVGLRGYIAERILKQKGFKAANLIGGLRTVKDLEEDGMAPTAANSTEQDKLPGPVSGQTAKATKTTERSTKATASSTSVTARTEILNVCGLSCPGPIVQVAKSMQALQDGDILEVTATDPGFVRDIDAWAKNTGNTLLSQGESGGQFSAKLQKGRGQAQPVRSAVAAAAPEMTQPAVKEKTMIVFDGDLDKAIAAFIIANGAAAMGNKVHMFFTFWGLSILRKHPAPSRSRSFMDKMFGKMLPSSSRKLGLSKFNMGGLGAKMIRRVMQQKGIDSLESLMQQAMEAGVELTACQMTMDIMGLRQEDLIDGVRIGGVATMLGNSDQSNMNLFIS